MKENKNKIEVEKEKQLGITTHKIALNTYQFIELI